ncbi:MAG: Sec-independent protein translocase protein TatB [Gammaproteobacteria bacterium]|nr:twin-arginine translocase subunit TatB [Gammaproteobacteria bacterium]
MFDAGFSELLLIFVIALLILGPERLPRVAAQLGRWIAKARRTANQLRWQLEREVALDEIYRTQPKRRPPSTPNSRASGAGTPGVSADASTAPHAAGAASTESADQGDASTTNPPEPEGKAAEPRATESRTSPEQGQGAEDQQPSESESDAAESSRSARATGAG